MNPRLTKEFRPLLLPWCVCALIGLGHTTRLFGGALQGMAGFAFFSGCLLLAVLPFGSEFQNRTWPLLLSQPLHRFQLWKEKFLAATIAVGALVTAHSIIVILAYKGVPFNSENLEDILPVVGFIVATICSAGFLTLGSRSIVGGIVFAGAGQFAVLGAVSGLIYLGYKILGRDPGDPDINKLPILLTYTIGGVVYSALSLWLGWRAFATMEVRDGLPSTDLRLPDWFTPKQLATFFRFRPTGALRNLVLKEVGLQKPVFTIAVVLVACWMIASLLLLMEPTYFAVYTFVLNTITVVHMLIVILLASCVPLGDEKSLGLAAWHLTLPVSSCRQWFVKLLVSFATAIVVGLILPLLLSCLTSLCIAQVGLVQLLDRESWRGVVMVFGITYVLVVLGFWSASFWENTVRSVLATIVALIGVGTVALLGAWVALEYSPGLQTAFAGTIQDAIRNHAFVLVTLVVTSVALRQSLTQFRCARSSSISLLKCSLVLATITFAGAFWCADLVKSLQQAQNAIHSL